MGWFYKNFNLILFFIFSFYSSIFSFDYSRIQVIPTPKRFISPDRLDIILKQVKAQIFLGCFIAMQVELEDQEDCFLDLDEIFTRYVVWNIFYQFYNIDLPLDFDFDDVKRELPVFENIFHLLNGLNIIEYFLKVRNEERNYYAALETLIAELFTITMVLSSLSFSSKINYKAYYKLRILFHAYILKDSKLSLSEINALSYINFLLNINFLLFDTIIDVFKRGRDTIKKVIVDHCIQFFYLQIDKNHFDEVYTWFNTNAKIYTNLSDILKRIERFS